MLEKKRLISRSKVEEGLKKETEEKSKEFCAAPDYKAPDPLGGVGDEM